MISHSAKSNRSTDGGRKRDALARLLERYSEARGFGTAGEPYADLEWVLGAKRDPQRRAADLDANMIELVALWVQDLIADMERFHAAGAAPGENPSSASSTRRSAAALNLRIAAENFVDAFRAIAVAK